MTLAPKSLSELISFLETLAEPHILCDRDYRIVAANQAYRVKWAGEAEPLGHRCYEVSHRYTVPCDQAGESCPLQGSLRSGKRERVLHLHHTPQGETFESIELSPVRDANGEITHYVEKLEPLPVARSLTHAQGLIGRSPVFMQMMEMVSRVAPSDASVLLQGESGTGKELVARAIHQLSRRAERPFVPVDCSGLTEKLFESELFGHERGAFTGATTRKTGLVEAASGGTLFLDEIGDIPLSIQVKLLRLLETGTYRLVGSPELRKAEVRIVSATHRSLTDMVLQGTFRQDIFYRLNIFPVCLPPLRERGDDSSPMLCSSALQPAGSFACPPRRRHGLAATPILAMCANYATSWSVPASSATETRLASRTCRRSRCRTFRGRTRSSHGQSAESNHHRPLRWQRLPSRFSPLRATERRWLVSSAARKEHSIDA